MSFNSFGAASGASELKLGEALGRMFEENEGIVHLDLSHNGFSIKACEAASTGLN